MALKEFEQVTEQFSHTQKMPVLFVGHGSPMNAAEDNAFARAWKTLGKSLPKPTAILAISAHWLTEGTFVHVAKKPKTIHDFWGFPKALYDMTYPCPGAPEIARETKELVKKVKVGEDTDWGIDHGTWIVLHHLYPNADIPVFQMSIDISKPSQFHYELGALLAPLRKKGVLIMGSGNLVHNLGRIAWDEKAEPFDWAIEFDATAKKLLEKGDHRSLVAYEKLGTAAALAIPTPDHYWPLLYTLGLKESGDGLTFPVEGIAHGSVSMRAVLMGQ